MTDRRWRQIEAAFETARTAPEGCQREALDRICGHDGALRREVESLLATVAIGDRTFERGPHEASRVVRDVAGIVDPLLGLEVDGWEIARAVGSGGMATVYLALGGAERAERVAIKVANPGPSDQQLGARAQLEGEVLASLDHPSIARFLGAGVLPDGRRYTRMEFVDGLPITDHADLQGLGIEERLELFAEVCDAVAHAHRRLVVHRDLKPANVLVGSDGRPRVVDFGIAKILQPHPDGGARTGEPATMLLTPEFTSPEQIRGEPATTASDVYALGLLLYQLLAGVPAYRVRSTHPAEIARVVCEVEPPLVSVAALQSADAVEIAGQRGTVPGRLRRRLRGDLDNVVSLALRKEPIERYATVERLLDDVRRVLRGERAAARPRTRSERLLRFARRNRLVVGSVAAVLLIASISAAIASSQASLARAEANTARLVTELLVDVVEAAEPGRLEGLAAIDFVAGIEGRLAEQGDLDPRVAATIDAALGRIFERLGKYERALEALQRARVGFGNASDPGVVGQLAVCEARIGVCHLRLGEEERAERAFQRAIGLAAEVDPLVVATAKTGLGALARERGDHAEAVAFSEEVLQLRGEVLGRDHPQYVLSLSNLAAARWGQGDLAGAAADLRAALEAARRAGVDRQPVGAQIVHNLGVLRNSQGRAGEARELLEQALALRLEILPDRHSRVAETQYALARVCQAAGDLPRAVELMRRSLAIRADATPDKWTTDDTRSVLGGMLFEAGDVEAAEPLLRESWDRLRDKLGNGHEHATEAALRLVDLLEATGQELDATQLRSSLPEAEPGAGHR